MRRAEPGDSHLMINEQRGAWAVPGPGEGSLSQNVVNLKCNTVSPKLSLISACLKFSLKDNIPKNSFFGGCRVQETVYLQYLLQVDKE
jgi:hypothetical protein